MNSPNLIVCSSSRRLRLPANQVGLALVEILIATAIAGILLAGLSGVGGMATQVLDDVSDRNELNRQAHFAMEQMIRAVSRSQKLMLPQPENISTLWPESVREFPPRLLFPNETAVLAFLLDTNQDLDADGFADADNDKDGAIDEDPGGDSNFDLAPGLFGIDDDNDGSVDEQHLLIWPGENLGPTNEDDDEDNYANEDLIDGIDNDGDGKLDEDIKKQTDGDNLSGIGGVDDDGDGNIDEDHKNDDDEDGSENEDWYDTVVFYLNAGTLMQRTPVPWDEDSSGSIDGRDFIISPVAENVSGFRLERLPPKGDRPVLLDVSLEITSPTTGQVVSLQSLIRVGSAK